MKLQLNQILISLFVGITILSCQKKKVTIDKVYSSLSSKDKNCPNLPYVFCNEHTMADNYIADSEIKSITDYISIFRRSYNPTSYRSSIWLPIMKDIIVSYDLPEDLVYIPVVESKLRNLSSPKGAAGFWQLIPGTARENGLVVNDEIDERLDQIKSTHAACKYLKKLRKRLPNWNLALAAYNSGLRNVQRTRARDLILHDDFFSHKWNTETTNYVYRLYATKEVLENKEKYRIKDYYDTDQE